MSASLNTDPSTPLSANLGTVQPTASGNVISTILSESSHPTALLFHVGFRTAAVFVYLFSSLLLGDSFVLTFVLTVVLLAADFWTVKNVTGRMLVGRRWWSDTAADGTTQWTFESRKGWQANPTDSRVFWGTLYGYTATWILLGLVALLRLSFAWLLVVGFALMMNITNLIGYSKCDHNVQTASPMSGMVGGYVGSKLNSFFS
jgi:hypothetical protein